MRKVFTMKDLILAKWNDILNILENEHGISHIISIHGSNLSRYIQLRITRSISLWTRITDREA